MADAQESASSSDVDEDVEEEDSGSKDEQETQEEWRTSMAKGDELVHARQYERAINLYTQAVRLIKDTEHEAELLAKRASAYCSLAKQVRSRPAKDSERHALFGLDPTQIASLAQKDASKAVALAPLNSQAHGSQGMACFLLERYEEAQAAYLEALSLDPENSQFSAGLAEVRTMLNGTVGAPDSNKRARIASKDLDDFECILCMKLLYEPVTTPCGHTFCKGCFARAMDHANRCPMCRTVLHVGRELAISVTLNTILMKSFPDEYRERGVEERAAASADQGNLVLPLFVMTVLLPGERMALNIFEPRYRLMVRRCMEGNRRFGMAQLRPGGQLEECACEAEIVECQPQPDGQYHLETVGRRRVRLLNSHECDGYRMASVAPFSDDSVAPGSEEESRVRELATSVDQLTTQLLDVALARMGRRQAVLQHLRRELGEKPACSQPEALSFWVGALLHKLEMFGAAKVPLMRMTSTRERLSMVQGVLQRILQGEPGGGPAGQQCSIM